MTSDVVAALQRAEAVFKRRPKTGMHEDAPAMAQWRGGTRVVARHANGAEIQTDLARELGGSGDQVSPGWLMRAGLAACAATSIAMAAAIQGIELTRLEVQARSRSDARGVLGMIDEGGQAVNPRPRDLQLHVRIGATGVANSRLRALVELGCQRSPVPDALQHAVPIAMVIDVVA